VKLQINALKPQTRIITFFFWAVIVFGAAIWIRVLFI
jgi:hypothetical protein